MSFDYAASADTSLRLITKFGQSVTRRAYVAGNYSTSTGAVGQTITDTTRKGVQLPLNSLSTPGKTTINGTLVQVGDSQLLLDAEGPVLQSDHYVIGNKEYTVVSFEELAPAGTVVLNTIHLRRA
jgi:hypothetical protein